MGNKIVEGLSSMTTSSREVASDILVMNFTIVNAALVGTPNKQSKEWVLVDTGPWGAYDGRRSYPSPRRTCQ